MQERLLKFRDIKLSPDKEVLVKGPCLFQGYLQNGKLQLPLNEDGYFQTGDLGEWDEHGHLKILGRKDNMFISGGENIQPEEIEKSLEKTVYVETAFVVGLKDHEFSKRPAAMVRLHSSFHWEEQTFKKINEELKAFLPGFKIPVKYFQLPPETNLKYNRKKLEKLAESETE